MNRQNFITINFKIFFILFATLSISCNTKRKMILDTIFAKSSLQNIETGIIISCTRCSCVDEYFSDENFKRILAKKIIVLCDTTCLDKSKHKYVVHYPQLSLDSLWEMNYNAVLLKKDDNNYRFINLKTGDNFENKIYSFFK